MFLEYDRPNLDRFLPRGPNIWLVWQDIVYRNIQIVKSSKFNDFNCHLLPITMTLDFLLLIHSLFILSLQWRHNEHDCVSNHQSRDCLLNRLFRHRWKKTSKLRVTGLCAGNSLVTGEFPAQRASNAENVSIWWCHHVPIRYVINTDLQPTF